MGGVVSDLGELLAAVVFGIGLTFGFTFDTAGPRLRSLPGQPVEREEPTAVDTSAADEPLTAERRTEAETEVEDPPQQVIRS